MPVAESAPQPFEESPVAAPAPDAGIDVEADTVAMRDTGDNTFFLRRYPRDEAGVPGAAVDTELDGTTPKGALVGTALPVGASAGGPNLVARVDRYVAADSPVVVPAGAQKVIVLAVVDDVTVDGAAVPAGSSITLDGNGFTVEEVTVSIAGAGDAIVATETMIEPPAAITDLTATPGDATVALAWTPPTSDGSAITSYDIERSATSDSVGFSALATDIAPAATYDDATAVNDTQYWYRVRAANGAGDGDWSNVATATPTDPPDAIADLAATDQETGGSVTLTWTAPSSGSAITSYDVQRSTDSGSGPWTDVGVDIPPATSYPQTGLTNGTQYWWRIRATSSIGDGDWSNVATATATLSAAVLLAGASAWYDAKDLLSASQATLPNRANPLADAAQLGSTSGADSSDPVALPWASENYVYLPGTDDNALITSATVAVPSLPFTAEVDVTLSTFGAQGLIGQYTVDGNNRSWAAQITASGQVRLYVSADGSTNEFASSTATLSGLGYSPGQRLRFRLALSVSGTIRCAVSISANGGESYSAFETLAEPSVSSLYAATSRVHFGCRYLLGVASGLRECMQGRLWGATLNGTQYVPTAQTILRSTSGLTTAIVTRPMLMSDAVDDHLQLPASDTPTFTKTAGKFTVLTLAQSFNSPATAARFFSTESATNDGFSLQVDSSDVVRAAHGDGPSTPVLAVSATYTLGSMQVAGATIDDGAMRSYRYGAALSAATALSGIAGTPVHGTPRIGARASAVANPMNMQWAATVLFPTALTQDELDAVSTYLIAGNYT